MSTRRNFLRTSGGFAIGSFFLPSLVQGNRNSKIKNIGIQLYTVRAEMIADPSGTLEKLAKIGFKELESARSEKGNYYGLKPKEIKKICSDLGMHLRSGHIHVDNEWQRSIDEAVETGQEYMISAVLPTPGQTVENYQKSADQLSKVGEDCKKANISFGYHNHETEFELVNGKPLYDVLLDRVDPALVKMELDLGWVVAAGYDPLAYFDKYPGRFPLWHVKDVDLIKKKSVEFGKGKLETVKIFQHARQSGMKYFFMEQEDYASTAFESIQFDFNYLEKLDY
jgi:sugar phosphate isomerase/epimerase